MQPKNIKRLAILGAACIVGVIVALLGSSSGDNPRRNGASSATAPRARSVSTSPPTARPAGPARVLLAIDRSASMRCPLELRTPDEQCTPELRKQERLLGEHRRLTRIGAARSFASGGIAVLKMPGDELGVSAFWTSRGTGTRREVLKRKPKRVLRRFVTLGPISGLPKLQELLGRLGATDGGTPLYDMIDQGARDLRTGSSAETAVNSLVILTDGGSNGSKLTLGELRSRLLAAGGADEPVRLLITATGEARCEELRTLTEPGDGDCFQAPTEKLVVCASQKIQTLVRQPQPPTPRNAEEKARDRAPCR